MSARCTNRIAAGLAAATLAALTLVVLSSPAHAEVPRQSPGAGTLPAGHALIEPYFFDAVVMGGYDRDGHRVGAPREHDYGSQSYVLYGLTDTLTVGVLPRFGFHDRGARGHSTQVGIGDLGLVAQLGLTRFDAERGIPALALNVTQTLPTGTYDRLGDHPADGLGAGAFTTALSLYAQSLFWLPTGRILRARLDLSYARSSSPDVRDVSVYGTTAGFRGQAHPGAAFTADAGWEYSATQHWVAALDVVYERDASTALRGQQAAADATTRAIAIDSGTASSLSLAPAIEYNATARIGVIAGVKLTIAGRNTARMIIPVTAINLVL
jgi:hypothetical protein